MQAYSIQDFRNGNHLKKGKKPKVSANQLTKSIIAYLNVNGWDAWRQNNGSYPDPRTLSSKIIGLCKSRRVPTLKEVQKLISSTYRKVKTHKKGIPDIIGFNKNSGLFICVEVKIGSDKLSPEQTYFLSQAKRSGAISIEARSLEDVVVVIRELKNKQK